VGEVAELIDDVSQRTDQHWRLIPGKLFPFGIDDFDI
jgi:hypothetical protein